FQAEDGIRDFHVTGVQTCALPISLSSRCVIVGRRSPAGITLPDARTSAKHLQIVSIDGESHFAVDLASRNGSFLSIPGRRFVVEIGRASCRERVLVLGGVESVKRK